MSPLCEDRDVSTLTQTRCEIGLFQRPCARRTRQSVPTTLMDGTIIPGPLGHNSLHSYGAHAQLWPGQRVNSSAPSTTHAPNNWTKPATD